MSAMQDVSGKTANTLLFADIICIKKLMFEMYRLLMKEMRGTCSVKTDKLSDLFIVESSWLVAEFKRLGSRVLLLFAVVCVCYGMMRHCRLPQRCK